MKKRNIAVFVLLAAIILLGGFLRFYHISSIPEGLYADEAMNGNNALETLRSGNILNGIKVFYPENNGREGLMVWLEMISISFFGNTNTAIRIISAIFGTLTILGMYLFALEIFQLDKKLDKQWIHDNNPGSKNMLAFQVIALLAAFFIAVSYWHLNFSRIGFRAILAPFFSNFGFYFILRGLRKNSITSLLLGAISIGLGFYTYIAFRFIPILLALPIVWYLLDWKKYKKDETKKISYCVPCAIVFILLVIFVTALPIGWHFLFHIQDFFGRAGEVSVFSAANPLLAFARSSALTFGMFFIRGDCNWRQNYNCSPELNFISQVFFAIGILYSLYFIFFRKKSANNLSGSRPYWFILTWLLVMLLPATLTTEGVPHSLRSLEATPAVFALAALGAWVFIDFLISRLELQKIKFVEAAKQIHRIQYEVASLILAILLIIPVMTYRQYFLQWADTAEAYGAFSTDITHMGEYLNNLPDSTEKYIIVNLSGVEVRSIPMPAQPIMYLTDTFREVSREKRNFIYLTKDDWENKIMVNKGQKVLITLLNGNDTNMLQALRAKFPDFKPKTPRDFIVLENY